MRELLCVLIAVPLGLSFAACADTNNGKAGLDITWGVRVPMRDGVHLHGTIYRAVNAEKPRPVILVITPYTTDNYHGWGKAFTKLGYHFAAVAVRGRGNSEGEFEPFVHDPQDGYDTVEWLAKQAWCDGQVVMWGVSYMGFNQWATLKELPPHLKTIVPAAAAHPGVDFPFFNGIYYPYDIQWLTLTSGKTYNNDLYNDEEAFWYPKFAHLFENHLAFRTLDTLVGNTSTAWHKWLDHPTPDAYWDATVPGPDDYARFDVPILTITGHYDADQPGAMAFYRRHMKYGSAEGKAKHYLLIGPWDHGGCVHPKREFKGLKFDEASVVDLNGLHRAWYDWITKGGERPEFLKKRVTYYVAGPGEGWKYASDLEAVATEKRTLYLHSEGGKANDVFQSGRLSTDPPRNESPDTFSYDPLDTSPVEWQMKDPQNKLLDQTAVMMLDGRGVVYHTAPLAEPLELAGFVELSVWMELDVPDTDFEAALYEITRDGTSILLTTDVLRARYRNDLRHAEPVTPGAVEKYVFDSFTFVARRLATGSRLRLVVACPNSMHMQKNYNSGGDVSAETAADARTAHVKLYHDLEHPSRLLIPITAE